ncbi:7973_t:CDS:2 [Entrophospora sp. SA101]|nr:7973_t:CDS:2 [Entrophospora sp. SA101]
MNLSTDEILQIKIVIINDEDDYYQQDKFTWEDFHAPKPVKFPDLENTMNFWISRVSAQGLIITDKVVKKQKYLLKN